jgi:hypothetical protein
MKNSISDNNKIKIKQNFIQINNKMKIVKLINNMMKKKTNLIVNKYMNQNRMN